MGTLWGPVVVEMIIGGGACLIVVIWYEKPCWKTKGLAMVRKSLVMAWNAFRFPVSLSISPSASETDGPRVAAGGGLMLM